VHERIRPFNTRDTYPDQVLDNDLCHAVVAGDLIFLRGQVGTDLDGGNLTMGDARAQARQAMKNVKQLLHEARAELSDICKIVVYITDRSNREPVYQEIGEWLRGVFPVSTGLIVAGLARPEWLVEIDVIAVRSAGREVGG